jgi:shikimate kinase
MGSGKSTVGRLVAERAAAEFRDLDRLIEARSGMSIAELWEAKGEAEFRRLESELLPDALEGQAVAALGGGAPLSDSNWRLIDELATTVFLDVPFEQLWARISRQAHRPLISGRRPEEVAELLERRRPLYTRARFTVDAAREPAAIAEDVFGLWSK